MPGNSILTLALTALGIAGALYIGFSWSLARVWCKSKRRPVSKSPADFDMVFQAIQFFSRGTPVNGWFIPARSGPSQQPAIILAHGWCKNAGEMLPLARLLHQTNFALLLYDARGHGASGDDGPITILKLAEDIVAGVDYLETRPDVDKGRLGVMGRSIGGSMEILYSRASGNADGRLISGRGHSNVMHDPSCTEEIVSFFDRYLHPA